MTAERPLMGTTLFTKGVVARLTIEPLHLSCPPAGPPGAASPDSTPHPARGRHGRGPCTGTSSSSMPSRGSGRPSGWQR